MVIPHPYSTEHVTGEGYRLTPETTISAPQELLGIAQRLQEQLRAATGLPLPLAGSGGYIALLRAEQLGPGAYPTPRDDGGGRRGAGGRPGRGPGGETPVPRAPPSVA